MKLMLTLGLASAVILTMPAGAFADTPRHFLQKALEGDNSEIMLGRLAADRARSERVKDFGRTLSDDHSQAREEVLRLGARMGVRRNRDIAPEAREERERLQGMQGREFDREFIRYMIRDHEKDVADFQEEAQQRHGPVSDLASQQLPTLQKHLEIALDLDRGGDRNRSGLNRSDRFRDNQDSGDDRLGDGLRRNNRGPDADDGSDRR